MTRPSVVRKTDEMCHPRRAAEQREAAGRRRPVPVRTAPVSLLRGRPPYGYQIVLVSRPDGPAYVLEPDRRSAPVVRRIFADYLAGSGLQRIAEGLTADTVPCPSAHDRTRNPHHGGLAWSKGAVRAILVNPRYTGLSAWDDPGDRRPAYEPLVEAGVFERVQQELAAKRHALGSAGPDRGPRVYVFRGLLRCGICNRLMQGAWNNGEAYYRCRIPEEYATANRIAHPRNVYLRERRLQPALDGWLAAACAPARLLELLRAGHQPQGEPVDPGATAAVGRAVRGLPEASPAERAGTYAALRLRLVYSPAQRLVQAKIALGSSRVPARAVIDLALVPASWRHEAAGRG